MKKGDRFLITTETHRLTVLRRGASRTAYGSCEICGPTVPMVNVDEAVTLSGWPTAEIVEGSTSGSLHTLETESGHLLICSRSLAELATRTSDIDHSEH
jgi:hypothetical protein